MQPGLPPLFPTPPTLTATAEDTESIVGASNRAQIQESISHLSMNSQASLHSSGASTPVVCSRTNTLTFADVDGMGDKYGGDDVELTPVPVWYELDIEAIYDHLNPRTKQGQAYQRGWRKRVIDSAGKPLTSIGLVANRLLKILVSKKLLPDTPLNSKLQSKKQDREQQKAAFMELATDMPALLLVRKFLSDNIFLPVNADGNVISVEDITVNVGARVIMLAADPETFEALSSIFSSPAKEDRCRHIDDKSLSFNDKWNALANEFMNAEDFCPENIWADDDSHISDVDPRLHPSPPWTGEAIKNTVCHSRTYGLAICW